MKTKKPVTPATYVTVRSNRLNRFRSMYLAGQVFPNPNWDHEEMVTFASIVGNEAASASMMLRIDAEFVSDDGMGTFPFEPPIIFDDDIDEITEIGGYDWSALGE